MKSPRTIVLSILFIFSIFIVSCISEDLNALVNTGKGVLRGRYEISRNGILYETYKGIRFGQVKQRFDESEDSGSWEGVKDAVEFGPHCAQVTLMGSPATGEEDCLFLNVFTPKADDKKRPVLVFIHGGGFNFGSPNDLGGGFLVDENIILVTFNYRVGVLGFLNTRDGVVNGNMGLKDQVLALKWVQENIEHFGGDKNRVTISGNSAGSASALYLMLSPLAKGLFHGVYGESGSILNPWAFIDSSIQEMSEMAENLNCKMGSTTEIVGCFREESLDNLLLAQKSLMKWNLDLFRIRPSIEMKSPRNPKPFLTKHPETILGEGDFPKVPVLLTATKDEGIFMYSALIMRTEPLLKEWEEEFGRIAPLALFLDEDAALKTRKVEVSKKILKFYLNDEGVTKEREQNLTNLFSDVYFLKGIQKTAFLLGSEMPVYMGLFSHIRKDISTVRLFGIEDEIDGVTHCDDMSYLFNPVDGPQPIPLVGELKSEKDIEFSKKFVKLIASFVSTGIPRVPFGKNPKWSPVSQPEIETKSLNWLTLENDPQMLVNPFGKRMQFWEKLYKPRSHLNEKEEL